MTSLHPTLKVVVINTENLFIFLERWDGKAIAEMTEIDWQKSNAGLLDNKPIQKTRDLAYTLLQLDADVILLTEVGGMESLKNFNLHFLGNRWTPHLLEGNSDRGIDMGYLTKGPWETKLKNFRDYVLPHPKHTKFSRDVLALELNFNGQTWFNVLLVHLKSKLNAKGDDFEGRTRRSVEVLGLAKIVANFDAQIPLLLGGDFNGDARSPHEPEFAPLYHHVNLKDAVDFSPMPPEERFSYIHFRSGRRTVQQLDYLFLNQEAQKLLIPQSVVFPRYVTSQGIPLPVPLNPSQKYALPSDHFPLYAEFNLTHHKYWRN